MKLLILMTVFLGLNAFAGDRVEKKHIFAPSNYELNTNAKEWCPYGKLQRLGPILITQVMTSSGDNYFAEFSCTTPEKKIPERIAFLEATRSEELRLEKKIAEEAQHCANSYYLLADQLENAAKRWKNYCKEHYVKCFLTLDDKFQYRIVETRNIQALEEGAKDLRKSIFESSNLCLSRNRKRMSMILKISFKDHFDHADWINWQLDNEVVSANHSGRDSVKEIDLLESGFTKTAEALHY